MDAAAERREQAQPPVAELVAEALHDHTLVGGQRAGRLAFVLEIGDEVACGELVEVVALAEPCERLRPTARAASEVLLELTGERAERPSQLDRPADRIAVPERQLAGLAGRGLDGDPVGRDLGRSRQLLAPRTMVSPTRLS